MQKKSQAAMEFLMTYGWALLVVLIAISALAYFGLLNPSKFLPEKVELGPGLSPVAYTMENGALTVYLKNNLGKTIYDVDLEMPECYDNIRMDKIIPEDTQQIRINCPEWIGEKGRVSKDISISYKTKVLSNTLSHSKTGRVSLNNNKFKCTSDSGSNNFYAGDGTQANPYQICNCIQLQNISNNDLYSNYELISNIDCSDTVNWNSGEGFNPITNYYGNFSGSNYVINSLFINSLVQNVGLFGRIHMAHISNLGLINVDITGNKTPILSIGALTGYLDYGNVSNSYSTGVIIALAGASSTQQIGGLAGYSESGIIKNSYSSVSITSSALASWHFVGGLLGGGDTSLPILLSNSYSTGSITATGGTNRYLGGLMGIIYDVGQISSSYWYNYTTDNVNNCWYDGNVDSYKNTGCTLCTDLECSNR